jgi:alanine racemase
MPRPTVAEVDLGAILHNYRAIMALTPAGTKGVAVVKADAYGHGAVPVARYLEANGVDIFALAITEEALELRDAGIQSRLLVMGPSPSEDAEAVVANEIESVVDGLAQAQDLNRAASKQATTARVHIKVDTGMGRRGIPLDEAHELIHAIATLPHVEIAGAMTHLPSADVTEEAEFTREQVALFKKLRASIEASGLSIPLWHMAGSAGTLLFPESHLNCVRPGIAVFGCYGSLSEQAVVSICQTMTLKTRIARIRTMPTGSPISYGSTFITSRTSRIALLPIGYADGYPRDLSNIGEVLVRGHRVPIVGRVCMDMTLVDITDHPDMDEGDEVVLYGKQEEDEILISTIAHEIDTIPNALLTTIGKRVPRVYVGAAAQSLS